MMDNPIEMMTFRNPPDPGDGPAPYRSANQPGDDARQNYCGDLDKVGKNEDFIEQVPLELLEIRHHILPDRKRFDFSLPNLDGSAAKRRLRMSNRVREFNAKLLMHLKRRWAERH